MKKIENEMYLIEEHQVQRHSPLWAACDLLCFATKNLRNSVVYFIRQHYFQHKHFRDANGCYVFTRESLYNVFKQTKEFKTLNHPEINKAIATRVFKDTLKEVEEMFRSYLALLYNKDASIRETAKLPGYLNKTKGRAVATFPKEALSFKEKGFIHLSMTDIKIKTSLKRKNIKEVRIVPRRGYYKLEIVYVKTAKKKVQSEVYGSIDLGVNNLITLTTNDPSIPALIINGRPIKAINQFYNKNVSLIQQKLGQQNLKTSRKLEILNQKRRNRLQDYMHKISRIVARFCKKYNISILVIGKNNGWKQDIKMNKKNKQNFVYITL